MTGATPENRTAPSPPPVKHVPESVLPAKPPKRNNYAFACAILASMTSILLGYGIVFSLNSFPVNAKNENSTNNIHTHIFFIDSNLSVYFADIGVMSGAMIYIKRDLKINDLQIGILAGSLNIYSLIGSCAAGRTSDWIGRRYTIVLAGAIFFAGAILMGLSPNYAFLMFGRFIAGIGVGYALMIAPVYTAEVSPASSRGFLNSFPEVKKTIIVYIKISKHIVLIIYLNNMIKHYKHKT